MTSSTNPRATGAIVTSTPRRAATARATTPSTGVSRMGNTPGTTASLGCTTPGRRVGTGSVSHRTSIHADHNTSTIPAPACIVGVLTSSSVEQRRGDQADAGDRRRRDGGRDGDRALRPPGEQLRPLGQVERHDEGHDSQSEVHRSSRASVPSSAESECCWSSTCVTPNWNHAPSVGRRAAAVSSSPRSSTSTWRAAIDPGGAVRPLVERSAQVGQLGGGLGQPGPLRQRLTHHAHPGSERRASPRDVGVPPVDALRLVPDLQALDPRLAPDVAHLGRRESVPAGPAGELGEPVGRPVVGQRRPVVLDLVVGGGEVVGDAQRHLVVPVAGQLSVQQRQRPEHLSGEVGAEAAGDRRLRGRVPVGGHLAALVDHDDEERGQRAHQVVVRGVAGALAPLGERGDEQRGRTHPHRRVAGLAERFPARSVDEVLTRPRQPAVGGVGGAVEPGGGRLLEAHRDPGVAHDVVAAEVDVVVAVVAVEVGAVGPLVVGEPVDRQLGARPQRGGRRVAAAITPTSCEPYFIFGNEVM